MTTVTPAAAEAAEAVRGHFAGKTVEVTPDGGGGVIVIVAGVEVGDRYEPPVTWLGFQVNAAYPASDVYPHYTGRLARADGRPHGQGIQQVTWQGREAMQLSRRSSRWNPAVDNAALKAQKVITWLAAQ